MLNFVLYFMVTYAENYPYRHGRFLRFGGTAR